MAVVARRRSLQEVAREQEDEALQSVAGAQLFFSGAVAPAAAAAAEGISVLPVCDLWTETKRPRTLEELARAGDLPTQRICAVLAHLLENPSTIPPLAFHGPPGSGKTTAAMAFARGLCRPGHERCRAEEGLEDRILRINGSEERRVETLNYLIGEFVRRPPLSDRRARRVVFVDEVDGMPSHSQDLLFAYLDEGTRLGATCFILAFNEAGLISERLASRCYAVHFGKADKRRSGDVIRSVIPAEHLRRFKEDVVEKIVDHGAGDLRASINMAFLLTYGTRVDEEDIGSKVDAYADDLEGRRIRESLARLAYGDFDEPDSALHRLDALGRTPLMYAVKSGQPEVCRLLLKRGATHKPDRDGVTPLRAAAAQGNESVVLLLLDMRATHEPDARGLTPLLAARLSGHDRICELLLQRDSPATAAAPAPAAAAAAAAACSSWEEAGGQTPLHAAAGRGDAAACRQILDQDPAQEFESTLVACFESCRDMGMILSRLQSEVCFIFESDPAARMACLDEIAESEARIASGGLITSLQISSLACMIAKRIINLKRKKSQKTVGPSK